MENESGITRGELESLLRFYAESGLDFPLADEPVSHFDLPRTEVSSASEKPTRSGGEPHQSAPQAAQRLPAIPDADAIALAVEAAANAQTLDELRAAVEAFEGCNLKLSARHTVFEGGARDAPVMLIQDAPGREDDATGAAASGPEGRLLDRMLESIGLSRETCYLGFAVPWRVPGNAAPSPLQAAICKPFANRQMELARPYIVVLLGNGAARIFLGETGNILQMRGEWRSLKASDNFEIPAIATLQPRYLLEHPAQKRFAWNDLQSIAARLRDSDA